MRILATVSILSLALGAAAAAEAQVSVSIVVGEAAAVHRARHHRAHIRVVRPSHPYWRCYREYRPHRPDRLVCVERRYRPAYRRPHPTGTPRRIRVVRVEGYDQQPARPSRARESRYERKPQDGERLPSR